MKLKFVDDKVVEQARVRGRGNKFDWPTIIEQLYANPNKWVELPETVPYPSGAYYAKKFEGIEVVCSGGNLLKPDNPDKKHWTVYIRFALTEQPNEEDKELF